MWVIIKDDGESIWENGIFKEKHIEKFGISNRRGD